MIAKQNYSIRIIRNEQQISDNNATPGNAGYLPTVDMSGGFSSKIPSMPFMKTRRVFYG